MSPRVIAILEMASRSDTSEKERLVSMNKFRMLADQAGGVDKLFATRAAPAIAEYVPYVHTSAKMAELERNNQSYLARITVLETEVERLRRENKNLNERLKRRFGDPKVTEDGTMSYNEFTREVMKRLVNADRRWQVVFAEQTGLSKPKFARFKHTKRVDADFVNALSKLKPVDPTERRERKWTRSEVERVRYLSEVAKWSEKNIAATLSDEFGERITDNMLKRLKLHSRDRTGVFRDGSFGPPIGKKRTEIRAEFEGKA